LKQSDIHELTDEQLVQRCQVELPYDVQSYRELLRRHQPLVYNTCRRRLGSDQDAEEVCQDAFLQVFHKIKQFEGRSQFKTWLYRVVYNLCIDRQRKLARQRKGDTSVAEQISDDEGIRSETQGTAAVQDEVNAAIAKLREDDQEIIVMRFVTGLSIAEIAETLDLKLSAAKMRLYRAQEQFKSHYDAIKEGTASAAALQSA
jgi:RNA polymerase sigma-70 factor (ECF subfamily)